MRMIRTCANQHQPNISSVFSYSNNNEKQRINFQPPSMTIPNKKTTQQN